MIRPANEQLIQDLSTT